MTVKIEETEIRSQAHEMWAEGTADVLPSNEDIIKLIGEKGFEATNIESWFDTCQLFYRWNCEIKPIAP